MLLARFRIAKRSPLVRTSYRPELPESQSNFGAAYWKLETTGSCTRLLAPRCPPRSTLIAPILVSVAAAAMVSGAAWLIWRQKGPQQGETTLVVGWLCLIFGLSGVWVVVLGGNRREAARGDVLRSERDSIELPRSASVFGRADVLRIELARFVIRSRVGGDTSMWSYCDLMLVRRGADGREMFELLVRNGGPLKRIGSALAERLGVAFVESNVGTFDWRTGELMHL